MNLSASAAYLPSYVSPNMAAALTGHSGRSIRRMVKAGVLPSEGGTWQRIPLAALEQITGKTITPEMYLKADRQLDRWRAQQAAYNRTRNQLPDRSDKGAHPQPNVTAAGVAADNGVHAAIELAESEPE